MSMPVAAPTGAKRKWRERIRTRLAHWSFLTYRAMTLGVRGVVIDADRRVLLVRHGYVSGWHFPGGGVETGETFETALRRELLEETCVQVQGAPQLHGLYFNGHVSSRDHVAVYVITDFVVVGERAPDHEIQEIGFFALDALPEGVTRGTRARLAEIFDRTPSNGWW